MSETLIETDSMAYSTDLAYLGEAALHNVVQILPPRRKLSDPLRDRLHGAGVLALTGVESAYIGAVISSNPDFQPIIRL